jgi:N-acyl-D-aspartate/D-glutamate deacylase
MLVSTQSPTRRSEVDVTNPDSIAQTLERARGLLSHLVDQSQVDQYKAGEPAALGSTQLRNMLIHVSNIEARVADAAEDPANAVKRLRDFSKVIERYRPTARELVVSLRSAADQLMSTVERPQSQLSSR